MDKANQEKTDVEFIELGTKLILEVIAEECPNKDFKVDCSPSSINSTSIFSWFALSIYFLPGIKIHYFSCGLGPIP